MRVGVLALQGDFAAHAVAFREFGVQVVEVRRTRELDGLDALVIPGGESTTLLNLMADEPWFERLREFHRCGGSLLGTCAGAILLAREVTGPAQAGLGLIDVTVERNAFGRQIDSFETDLDWDGDDEPLPAVFIRAPRFRRTGPGVEVLAKLEDEPVLVRQGRVTAGTFHPELTADRRLQRRFLESIAGRTTPEGVQTPRLEAAADPGGAQRRVTC
ncbi:MAG: pyridoxal 5'-phosphate synthase glutaminase subunit PdxT [bacterium]|nr:pyridoxal 5'-phosphate synthase glutaminase subunit PdxT [bacterium]